MRLRFALLIALALPTSGLAQQPALSGTFTAGPLAIAFEADTVRISRAGQLAVMGVFLIRGDTVTFRDLSGAIACNSSVMGRYLWKTDGTSLVLTLVEDGCSGRAGACDRARELSRCHQDPPDGAPSRRVTRTRKRPA